MAVHDVSVTETATASDTLISPDAIVCDVLTEALVAETGELFLDAIVIEVLHSTIVVADLTESNVALDSTPSVTGDWQVSQTDAANALDWLTTFAAGGGGGGAAGLYGYGGYGEDGRVDGTGGYGGYGDNNLTPYQPTPGADGNNGVEWDGIIGSGSGAAGGSWSPAGIGQAGGTGGLYGGGGGGGGGGPLGGGLGGLGGAGIVFIQYTSSVTGLLVQQALHQEDANPYIVPSDWTDSNTILLIGAGGCGGPGSTIKGGGGGKGGESLSVRNYDELSPGDEVEFFITAPTDVCANPDGGDGNPGTKFGGFTAGAGVNGDGTGGGTSGVPSGFPAGSYDIFGGGPGGPGGVMNTLVFIRSAEIEEPAEATDAANFTVIRAPKPPGPRPSIIASNVPSATAQQPYPPVPTHMENTYGWVEQIARTTNLVLAGKTNNTLASFTLTPNSSTTTLYMSQIGATSVISLTPLTQHAAEEKLWISDQKVGQATINHSSAATTDRTYSVMVVA